MFLNDVNFLNFPVITFKKASMQNLNEFYNLIYDKFKTEEDLGSKWKDDCMKALMSQDKQELKRLEKQGGKIVLIDDAIDLLIDNFTLAEHDDKQIDFLKNMILNLKGYIKSIEFKENPAQIIFTTNKGKIIASKLTEVYPNFKHIRGIETRERHGTCHASAAAVSKNLDNQNKVATGYVYTFGEGYKYLHSWVEVEIEGEWFVIDVTRNLIMKKESYYKIRNINGRVYKISRDTLINDEPIRRVLDSENQWLNKLYLSNRHQAIEVYNQIKQREKEKKENDPLYKAAKHMYDSFQRQN